MQVYFATNLSSVIGIDEPVASVGQWRKTLPDRSRRPGL